MAKINPTAEAAALGATKGKKLTIVFSGKYADLYDYISSEALADDRDMDTWILRYLYDGLSENFILGDKPAA